MRYGDVIHPLSFRAGSATGLRLRITARSTGVSTAATRSDPLVLLVFNLLRQLHAARLAYAGACRKGGPPGAPAGSERLAGVLAATMRGPPGSGPGARLDNGMRRQVTVGFGNGQPASSIRPPRDHRSPNPGHAHSRTRPGIFAPARRPPDTYG